MSKTLSLGTDNIGKLLFNYATPAIIAMASSSLYHLIDSAFVGHGVGGAAIAGMAITMPIMNIGAAFGAMVGIGAGARISLRLGEGNKAAAEKTLCNAVLLNIIIGFTIMVLMLTFLDEILVLFSGGKASAETLEYARQFMSIILYGNITQHLYLGLNDMIRASGNPRKSMAIMLTSVAINLVLNPLFIFVFHWGIQGSAAATVISQFVCFLIALSHFCSKSSFLRFKREAFHFDWKIVGNILSIGLAPFLMNICASMVAAFVNTAMLQFGGLGAHDIVPREQGASDLYVGAYGIVNRVALLFIMVVQGLNQGMQPIVGYNYGAQLYQRMLRAFKLAVYCATCVMSFLFLFGEIWPEGFIRLFTHDEVLIAQSITPARIMLAVMFAIGFPMITGNFYTSIGMAPKAIFLSLTRQVLFLIPLIIGLPLLFESLGIAPIWGVWWSWPISDSLSVIIAMIVFNRDMRKFKFLNQQPI